MYRIYMEQLLLKISYFIVLLPLLTGLIFWRKTKRFSRGLILLSFVAAVPHLLAASGIAPSERNIIYNLYTVVEFIIMFSIFRPRFVTSFSKRVLGLSLIIGGVLSIPILISKNFITDFNNELVCLTNLVYLFWILVLMRDTYLFDTPLFTKKDPFTFFALGIIVYASASMLVMGLYNFLLENPQSPVAKLWVFHDFSNIFIYTMFFVGILTEITNHKGNSVGNV